MEATHGDEKKYGLKEVHPVPRTAETEQSVIIQVNIVRVFLEYDKDARTTDARDEVAQIVVTCLELTTHQVPLSLR